MKTDSYQRPSDIRVTGARFTMQEVTDAAKAYAELKRPTKPPVKVGL